MATLQKLRNAGPLLIIFVGLALLAFIAGDAFRIFQSPQGAQTVGSVNGKEVTAAEFQQLYEEYSNVIKFVRGTSSLSENEMSNIKDEAWSNYCNNTLIQDEAEKLGLTVTTAELQAIITKGENPTLMQTPFRNEQGKFDIELLNNFLAQYNQNKDDAAFVQQYQPFYDYWKFMEKTIMQEALAAKYLSLIEKSFISNPVAAQYAFDANNITYDVELKKYPYTAVADSTVTVTDSDKKKIYEEEKDKYKDLAESRSIKYVSVRVTPSAKDRSELRKEMTEYADSLGSSNEYASIVRLSNSEVPYSSLAWSKAAYPEDVQLRIDSVKENTVVGPIYTMSDNSFTVFKLIGKETVSDSVLYRNLVVNAETPERTAFITDSLLAELKKGADFKEIAAKYKQETNDSLWLTSAMYEGAAVDGDNAKYLTTLLNGKKGEYSILSLDNAPAKIIYQVLDKKNPKTKYHAAVIKRTVEFSSETYNEVSDKFSQFVALCKTVEDLEKNAEESGYRVITPSRPLYNWAHSVANNIAGTRDAIRWLFNEANVGDVSPLYECGNNDNLLVVALTGINEKGAPTMERLDPMITSMAVKNKKAEKIMAEIKGKSFDELSSINGVKSETVKHISFAAPASIDKNSEPAISAAVTKLQIGETSAPIKGNDGVFVVKLTAKNTGKAEFNAEQEQNSLKLQGQNCTNFVMRDLMENGEITDNRYLYF